MAGSLLRRADPTTAGLWPRASAILALEALRAGLRGLWARRGLGFRAGSMRTQLICLRTYLGDPELAARTSHAASALLRAGHHHPYELAPTVGELESWFSVVGELIEKVDSSPEPTP
jgi:hypothetical protein